MTDKQMAEKREEFFDGLVTEIEHYQGESEPLIEVFIQDDKFEDLWQRVSKLVEEVERETKEIDRKLMKKVADNDYQFGFIRGTQTSGTINPLRISEHEKERKKIRDEMMKRFYN